MPFNRDHSIAVKASSLLLVYRCLPSRLGGLLGGCSRLGLDSYLPFSKSLYSHCYGIVIILFQCIYAFPNGWGDIVEDALGEA